MEIQKTTLQVEGSQEDMYCKDGLQVIVITKGLLFRKRSKKLGTHEGKSAERYHRRLFPFRQLQRRYGRRIVIVVMCLLCMAFFSRRTYAILGSVDVHVQIARLCFYLFLSLDKAISKMRPVFTTSVFF